jgi:hypothetical protein
MHAEMTKHGTLTRGPIELQYNSHLKALAAVRRADMARKQSQLTRETMRAAQGQGQGQGQAGAGAATGAAAGTSE